MSDQVGINQLKRRDFLRAGLVFGAGAAGLAAGYAAVPDAFARAVYAAKQEGITNDNVLVMIQLAGGNDGLRTLVPLADPLLHDLRPGLAGSMVAKALPLNNEYGLNHNLAGIKGLWDKGKVAIVQGVGYPNPTLTLRFHDRTRAANASATWSIRSGWLSSNTTARTTAPIAESAKES